MPIPSAIDTPELDSVQISLPASGVSFSNFLHYDLNEHYLTPCAAWNFSLDEDELTDAVKDVLIVGAGVQVKINDLQQCCGYIDKVSVRSGRGGTVWQMDCREWNSPIVDAHVDPKVQFSSTMTLQQVLQAALAPFGQFATSTSPGGDINLITDASANRNVITGATRGTKTNKNGTIVKSALAHQVKPFQHEGLWGFMSRVSQRFGLWLRPSADGTTIIASQPDFTQDPSYGLVHSVSDGTQNNIIDGMFDLSRLNQPAVIYASGWGGGGVFANSTLRAVILNPCISSNTAAIAENYPGVTVVTPPILGGIGAGFSPTGAFTDPNARPLFLYDPESHTQAELQSFLLRELSLRMRESLVATYTIEGHTLGSQPIAIDTIVQVDDDRSNFSGQLWVQDRTFSKSPSGGTLTKMTLIRPGTLTFA
jgi:prophage tail gpP-like protein